MIHELHSVRYKLRPLTIPLAFFATFCLVILNTTGFPNAAFSGRVLWSDNRFGWPNEYLVTDLSVEQNEQLKLWRQNGRNGPVSPGAITFRQDKIQEFSLLMLSSNFAVCLIVVLLGGFVMEFWQRFFDRPRQIGLWSYFFLVLLAAVAVWFARHEYSVDLYYSYWPWPQFASAAAFILVTLATIGFAIYRFATVNKVWPHGPPAANHR